MSKAIGGAFGTILGAIIIAWAFSSVDVPDPNREVINALPNTDPNVKALGNTALDVADAGETIKTVRNVATALAVIIASAGVIGWLSRR